MIYTINYFHIIAIFIFIFYDLIYPMFNKTHSVI